MRPPTPARPGVMQSVPMPVMVTPPPPNPRPEPLPVRSPRPGNAPASGRRRRMPRFGVDAAGRSGASANAGSANGDAGAAAKAGSPAFEPPASGTETEGSRTGTAAAGAAPCPPPPSAEPAAPPEGNAPGGWIRTTSMVRSGGRSAVDPERSKPAAVWVLSGIVTETQARRATCTSADTPSETATRPRTDGRRLGARPETETVTSFGLTIVL